MWFAPLFRGQTWRESWVAIRRARRDTRARAYLLRIFAMVFFAGYSVVLIFAFVSGLGADSTFFVVAGIVLICFVSVLAIHKWRDRQEARSASPAVAPELQREMQKEALLIAILLIRAGSERMMEKELPPEVEVITRRAQRERLMQLALWDDLPAAMKDLLLLPNGHWTDRQKWAAESCWEYFSVLRWVVRLDDSLRTLDRPPVYDLAKAREVVHSFEAWQPGDTLAPWDLRPWRAQAGYHLGRLWTEAVARGLLQEGIEPDQREQALRSKREIDADGASTDLLIDAQTVSELSNPQLWFLLRMAHRRWEILNFLVDWLSKDDPGEGLRQIWSKAIID